jgi:small subunit ribosomal protein S1
VIKLDPEHKKIALSIKDDLVERNQKNHDDIVMGETKKKPSKKSAKSEGMSESQHAPEGVGSKEPS